MDRTLGRGLSSFGSLWYLSGTSSQIERSVSTRTSPSGSDGSSAVHDVITEQRYGGVVTEIAFLRSATRRSRG